MYHIVPSPVWRIWTTLTHYPALPKLLFANLQNLASDSRSPTKRSDLNGRGQATKGDNVQGEYIESHAIMRVIRNFKLKWIWSILLSPRHGERGNNITEAFYFRAYWWRRLFERNGWRVVKEQPSELFYSGNQLLGTLMSMQTRRKLACLLGSSTLLFKVVRSTE